MIKTFENCSPEYQITIVWFFIFLTLLCMILVIYEGTGTGFSFTNYNAHEMLATVRNAERVYYDNKREWNKMVDRAMAADFSWSHSAKQYEEMYNWLIGDK